MNYAVYARVSTDKDEQISSVENQIDICRNWLERNGFEWDENSVYKDEGISGTLFLDRPAIQLILEKARNKEIEMVVFKSISRMARDLKDSLEIREVMAAHGVRIISIEEGYDSFKAGKNDMAFELWSLFSAQYSRTLSSSISASLAAKVRRGEHIGKTPYGYDKVEGFLVINNEEAEIIRKMFEWYNNGIGFKNITHRLNEMGVKPKMKDIWQVTSVQRIIRNPIYFGRFILNQYGSIKVDGRKKQVRNPEEQWIIFEDHHPAIISKEVWEKANSKKYTDYKVRITPWNEFRYIAKCGKCGSNMVIMQSGKKRKKPHNGTTYWRYLKCSAFRRAGEYGCKNHVPIQYEDFRSFIIQRLIEKGRDLELTFESDFTANKKKEVERLTKKITQLDEKKTSLVDLYLDHLITKEEFEKARNKLEEGIIKSQEKLLLMQRTDHTQKQIDNIRNAFAQLENQDQDLFNVFQVLISLIKVYHDGTIDIEYTFENN